MDPSSGAYSPTMRLNSVVFPAPPRRGRSGPSPSPTAPPPCTGPRRGCRRRSSSRRPSRGSGRRPPSPSENPPRTFGDVLPLRQETLGSEQHDQDEDDPDRHQPKVEDLRRQVARQVEPVLRPDGEELE